MRRVRTGIVGCGKVGLAHALALRSLGESHFVGTTDSEACRAEAFAARFGAVAFGSVRDMVVEGGVEAVIVCTPHSAHTASAIEAARAAEPRWFCIGHLTLAGIQLRAARPGAPPYRTRAPRQGGRLSHLGSNDRRWTAGTAELPPKDRERELPTNHDWFRDILRRTDSSST